MEVNCWRSRHVVSQFPLDKDSLKLVVGSKTYSGAYVVKKIKRRAYNIHLTTPHSQIEEVFRLDGKERENVTKRDIPST